MNYMSEVAKILGVESGEKFEVKMPNSSCYVEAMITVNGLIILDHNIAGPDAIHWKPYVLEKLLNGTYTIKRKPWKPIYKQNYWSIKPNGEAMCYLWVDQWVDIYHYKIGNCYKTEEEALNNYDKWMKFYKSDEVLEV